MKALALIPLVVIASLGAQDAELAFQGSTPGQTRQDNSLEMKLHWCPPGSFLMGSPESETGRDAYETPHKVTLTQGFWMGETEVTQGQWQQIMQRSLLDQAELMLQDDNLYPVGGKQITLREASGAAVGNKAAASICAAKAPNIPVYYVSWDDATEFCKRLTEREQKGGRLMEGCAYVLPTEAQWEYACRAGTQTATYAGDMTVLGENNVPVLDDIAWYGGNSSVGYKGAGWTTNGWPNQAHPGKIAGPRRVGQKKPNAWGLKDTLGNMYEWVSDLAGVYPSGEVTDPTGPTEGTDHPYRGGSWNHYGVQSRAAKSYQALPTYRVNHLSFRVALVKKGTGKE